MTFSLYQSFIAVPHDLREAARMYHLSPWQSFWRLEVPFAMPQLIWNMMMSVSGGWFFVVASEAISVADQHVKLPGIGSYIALAIDQRDLGAVLYAILAPCSSLILLYDQLLFRPLLAWAQRFKFEELGRGRDRAALVPHHDAARTGRAAAAPAASVPALALLSRAHAVTCRVRRCRRQPAPRHSAPVRHGLDRLPAAGRALCAL